MTLDPRFLRGVDHFNRREFYDAHEVWEELWNDAHGDDNRFVQGLIQFATALHHFEAYNLKGTRILYDGGLELLAPFSGRTYWGLDVKKFIDDMTQCVAGVLATDCASLPGRYNPKKKEFPVKIDDALVPKIALAPQAAHG